MSTKQPATPLPWHVNFRAYPADNIPQHIKGDDGRVGTTVVTFNAEARVKGDARRQNAAYIVHACNAYPKLVEALRAVINGNKAALTVTQATGVLDDLAQQATALLAELDRP